MRITLAQINRWSRFFLVLTLLSCPYLIYLAATVEFGTSFVEAWLPGDDDARDRYREFRREFAEDQFLIVSWRDCRIDDPRLRDFSDKCRQLAEEQPTLRIQEVVDSRSLVLDLQSTIRGLSMSNALARVAGFGIGRDLTSFVTLVVEQAPIRERALLISTIRQVAKDDLGIEAKDLILAGEPYQVYLIDRSSREAIQYYVAPSSVLALLVAWFCLGRLRYTFLVFAIAGFGQLLGLALVSYFVKEMSAVLVVLPTLVFMLTLSAAVHLANYFREAGGEGKTNAGAKALLAGASPCLLATLTTVFGFASLTISQLNPVWQFGALAALGLSIASAVLLTLFPAVASIFSTARLAILDRTNLPSKGAFDATGSLLKRLAAWRPLPISAFGILFLVFALVGVSKLQTSTEFDDMFPADSPAVQSLRWVEEKIGPITALEFLIEFSEQESGSAELIDRMQLLARIHFALRRQEFVDSASSAVTYLPPLPSGRGTGSTIRRAVLGKKIEDNLSTLSAKGLVHIEAGTETWRISLRVRELDGNNFASVRDQLQKVADDTIAEHFTNSESSPPTVEVTGLRTVIEKAHYALLTDLGGSFTAAFLLITPVMMVIVRGFVSGGFLMVPNVLPVAIVFGCMGWLGIQLDVASILTASVALGIAVDDTLHFMTWFMRARRKGLAPRQAVNIAIDKCTRPMLNTTFICTGAMLPFFFSDFLPTSKFALLMILILSGAIVGDLILLPAMLQTKLGHWIGAKRNQNSTHGAGDATS